MNRLTSKERVLAALNHREPDRIPLDLGSTVVTGVSRTALIRFLDHAKIPHGEIDFHDIVQQLGKIPEEVLKRLNVDTRALDPQPSSTWKLEIARRGEDEVFFDEWGIGWRKPAKSGFYFDMFHHPLKGLGGAAGLDRYDWPDPEDPARYKDLDQRARVLEEDTGAALVLGRMGAGIVELAAWMRGFEDFFMDLASKPGFACALMDRVTEIKMRYWEIALSKVKARIVVVSEADDLATQRGLILSPVSYRKLIKPRHKRLMAHIKKLAPHAFIFFHSCGAVRELIPDFIEAGVDILNPVQLSAAGMDPYGLKNDFGDVLTFWGGGVDTQHVLPCGTPQEVRDEVRRCIDALAPGGGFVFNTVHNIQHDVPPENLAALFDALQEYGVYAGREAGG